jgi:hypothetical protein
MDGVLKEAKVDRDDFRKLYGDDALKSDYDFKRLILESTPDKITLLTSDQTAASPLRARRPELWDLRRAGKGIQRVSIWASAKPSETLERRTFSREWSPGFNFWPETKWNHNHLAGRYHPHSTNNSQDLS